MIATKKLVLFLLFFSICCCDFSLIAQPVYLQQQVDFTINGNRLDNALAGGLNNPIFSEIDLDNNQVMDLVVFDRKGNVVIPFINKGTPNTSDYHFAPHLIDNFPSMSSWALVRDYDLDGIGDLFCYAVVPAGARVYKGYYNSDNEIAFTLEEEILQFPGFNQFPTNIYISSEDLSAFDDIDGDGDLDILTFGLLGGYLELYDNKSVEMGYGSDSLIFRLVDDCWGRAYESGLTPALDLSPSIDSCLGRSTFVGQKQGVHAGSTVLTLDLDNDNDKELILGDLSFPNLIQLDNGGNKDTAWLNNQDTNFPSYDVPGDVVIFPATFYLDVNNDGKKDLLASPTAQNVSENLEVAWYYKNVTNNENPQFSFQQEDFLVNTMIDMGTGAYPAFFDHNGDGLMDIVVGHFGFFESGGTYTSSLYLFENVGTLTEPAFNLVDTDYAGLAYLDLRGIHPIFGDMDADGDLDLLVGESAGKLVFSKNEDTGNGIASFPVLKTGYQNIAIGQHSAPLLMDVNEDGLTDLIIGERTGNINFYQNAGTAAAPTFVEVNTNFGEIDTRQIGFPTGYSTPILLEENNERFIFTGSSSGINRLYKINNDSLYSGSFELVTEDYIGIKVGQHTAFSVHDINNDGNLDYLVGNQRGGLSLYGTDWPIIDATYSPIAPLGVHLFPNPTQGALTIAFDQMPTSAVRLKIVDVLGRDCLQQQLSGTSTLDLSTWPSGVYFCRLEMEGQFKTMKFVIK